MCAGQILTLPAELLDQHTVRATPRRRQPARGVVLLVLRLVQVALSALPPQFKAQPGSFDHPRSHQKHADGSYQARVHGFGAAHPSDKSTLAHSRPADVTLGPEPP
ncbi:hypothetical protein CCM_02869 [Cordyceps militaris CM01]|uniref:Uncharacterized protein n=1 Tax=Cordyceps militaris (strain CM01) TaxID=983644 RepID=G3JCD7_CORMM|nr:uncharacterized protein CCM_02869 [Cordyceps militaris CM01]EGX94598.1 hypothetical protein CCM_02869 [Cordyceps militaris CM01]